MTDYSGNDPIIKAAIERLHKNVLTETIAGNNEPVDDYGLHRIIEHINSLETKVSKLNTEVSKTGKLSDVDKTKTSQHNGTDKAIDLYSKGKEQKFYDILFQTSELAKLGTWEEDYGKKVAIWDELSKHIFEVDDDMEIRPGSLLVFFKEGESRNNLLEASDIAIHYGKPYDLELEITTAKGKTKWVRVIGQPEFENGTCKRLFGIIQDIDKVKKSEHNLRVSEEKFRGLLESAPDAMVIVNEKGGIVFVNKKAEKTFGYSSEEMLGKSHEMLIPKNFKKHHLFYIAELINNPSTRLMDGGQNLFGLRRDGIEFPVEISLCPIQTREGILISSAIRDVTLKREREEEQKATYELIGEQNKRLLNFAHIVSHNLRNHTANFNMLLDLFEHAETNEEKEEYFSYLRSLSIAFNESIENLNELVKVQISIKNTKEHIVIKDFLKRVLITLTGEISLSRATINDHIQKDFTIEYNAAYMESILLNLLSNAVKYRHRDRTPVINIYAYYEKGRPVIEVSDNGLGLDLQLYGSKLFGMYKTFHGNKDAKGIGLFITKNQVEALGGKIEVHSEVGKGTTFKVYLS